MIIECAGDSHKFGCCMLYLPNDLAKRIIAFGKKHIPEDQLAGDGREQDPHCTLLYGFLPEVGLDELRKLMPDGPVPAELGKVGRFDTAEEFDVLKIEVLGDELHEAHGRMAEAPNKDPHADEYRPHVTLAYVKKGACRELDGDDSFDGVELELDDLVWSPAGEDDEDRKQHVRLGKETAKASLRGGWLRRRPA